MTHDRYNQSVLRNGCGDKRRITQILRPEGAATSILRTSSNFLPFFFYYSYIFESFFLPRIKIILLTPNFHTFFFFNNRHDFIEFQQQERTKQNEEKSICR